jgi:hypothetical protein
MGTQTVTQETRAQRLLLADRLRGLSGSIRASRLEYNRIYGPGVTVIPRGNIVKILHTKMNYRSPENPSGDIWCRVKDLWGDLEMWVPSTFIVV